VVTHIDKNSNLTRWALADVMKISLRIARGDTGYDPEEVKFNQKLVDKLKFCKEVLLSIHNASQDDDDDVPVDGSAPTAVGPDPKMHDFGSLGLAGKTSKTSLR